MVFTVHPIRLVSAAGQVASYLRGEMERGNWTDKIPGVGWLAAELGVNRKTVEAALRRLENEGLLENQGAGRKRRITLNGGRNARPLQVAIFNHEPMALTEGYMVELQHLLKEAGHHAFFSEKSLLELDMKLPAIRRLVAKTQADAWVVIAGSHEVLEWFISQGIPTFALFGRRDGLPIAGVGPDKVTTIATATRTLIGLGHRRIVLLTRTERRLPLPGNSERAFLNELQAQGIATGAFNLPDWKDSAEGFHKCLESLLEFTPPTALIVDEAPFYVAALQFLARRGLKVPEDVSLVCTDYDRSFAWCRPPVSHIRWDVRPVQRRIVHWTNNVSRGKRDLRQSLTPAEFVPGGTIGPVKVR